MSGHSKWSTIKHKKAKTDSARGKVFTKILKEITTAAKIGGGDLNGNSRLRMAVDKAKESNMPSSNVERAIKKGTGELEGVSYEEVTYEGYGPSGTAVLVEAMTDNANRTVSELRNLFSKNGGNLGQTGCVAWIFKKKGIITFEKKGIDSDTLSMAAIEAGAEDIEDQESSIDIVTTPENFEKVRDTLKEQKFASTNAEISMVPSNKVKIEDKETADKILKLMSVIEDNDDVQKVHSNFDIPDNLIDETSS
ncbi:MAG: YebC/PmpR family DNA-binding transcriptional regulator [Candidatus Saganbacteria bacterium]|nr:YebC/PmpR family DNA-binding transcriptional regulator [Candidatus Saganbacteria bacterium]